MKQAVLVLVLAIGLFMTGALPFEGSDVAALVPVEALTVDLRDGQVILDGGQCNGRGESWEAALEDLQHSASGKVFLGTAEQIVISRRAASLIPDVIRSDRLRPAAVVCVCPGDPPDPEEAAKYLSAHNAGTTIQKMQEVMLRGEGIALPMLVKTEGGLRLYGAEDR